MRRNYLDDENCSVRRGDSRFWKMLSLFWFLLAGCFAALSFILKQKNDEYRDALIEMSDILPPEGEEAAELRRKDWQSAHAPANRKTVEERLEEQRVQES